jgi:hypothetical protein
MSAEIVTNAAAAGAVVGQAAIKMFMDRAAAVGASTDLVSFSQAARVEPLVLVDTDALYVEELHDVLQSMQSIFAGYYLQALSLDSALGNVKVIDTLGKFNPNGHSNPHGNLKRDVANNFGGMKFKYSKGDGMQFSMEAYKDALPDFRNMDDQAVALEAMDDFGNDMNKNGRKVQSPFDNDKDYKNWKADREVARSDEQDADRHAQKERQRQQDAERAEDRAKNKRRDTENELDRAADRDYQLQERARTAAEREAAEKKSKAEGERVGLHVDEGALKDIREASNLSVGKVINVELKNNGQTFNVPVAIRLVVNTIPSAKLVHILSLNAYQLHSADDRWHGYKSGRLSFVKDLIFARDLIDEHRRSLMTSSDSVYHNVIKREQKSLMAAFISGVPSVASASNMIVTTTNSIEELEQSMPGKFSDFKWRQQVFERTSLMIVAVIDKEWNRVTFYHRGLPDATDVSFRDIKASGKGNGPDVSDILKAYTLGQAPRL